MRILTSGSLNIPGNNNNNIIGIVVITINYRTLKALPNLLELEAHYSKIILNKPKKVCINDFESLKVIGKGGFSKVYM